MKSITVKFHLKDVEGMKTDKEIAKAILDNLVDNDCYDITVNISNYNC